MLNLKITYPLQKVGESVLGIALHDIPPTGLMQFELRSHASFMPLAPGDIVAVDADDNVRGIVKLEQLWTYEVILNMPGIEPGMTPTEAHPAMKAVAELEEKWRDAAWVTRPTNFTFLVSAQTEEWLKAEVFDHPYVRYVERVRDPRMKIDFDVAVAHPDLDGSGIGPWA
jgi:hypothetical protein